MTTTSPSLHRARWAAIGAAVAVSIGAGGLGIARAADHDAASAFTAVEPCRLADTRSGPSHVGYRTSALGAGDVWTIGTREDAGQCGDSLPADATALEVNVTAVGATQPTYLTLYPTGTERPTASHLNPVPGQPPTPNSVTVGLDRYGSFSMYNAFGAVDVIVDVVGYYRPLDLDDRYYTRAQVDAMVAGGDDDHDTYSRDEIDSMLSGYQTKAAATAALADMPTTEAGKIAYAYVCDGATPIQLDVPLDGCGSYHSPNGGTPWVRHLATGEYAIGFPDLPVGDGTFHVSPIDGPKPRYCVVMGSNDTEIGVKCFDLNGWATDTEFNLLFIH